MKEEIKAHKQKTSTRREVLKKVGTASAFLAPTIASFKIADLAVAGSGGSIPQPKFTNTFKGFGPPKGFGPFNLNGPPKGFGPFNLNGPPKGFGPSNRFGPPKGFGPFSGFGQFRPPKKPNRR